MTRSTIRHLRSLTIVAIALTIAAAACDTGPGTPGTLRAHWTLGPVVTCDDLHLVSLEARAMAGSLALASAVGPCDPAAADGTLTLVEVPPGAYQVVVLGFDTEGVPTYRGESSGSVAVPDGGEADSLPIRLEEAPARLVVDWDVGGKCSNAGIDRVLVSLFDAKGFPLEVAPRQVECDATFDDPELGDEVPGVLFGALPSADDLIVAVDALDAAGAPAGSGVLPHVDLPAGQVVEVLVVVD